MTFTESVQGEKGQSVTPHFKTGSFKNRTHLAPAGTTTCFVQRTTTQILTNGSALPSYSHTHYLQKQQI